MSTDEWVNAKDVTVEGLSTSDPATSFTDVQKFETPKVITLDGPTGFVYTLYTSKGVAKSDRGLGGESAWLADRSAKNAKGQTVYRVSTDEWVIAGTGVHVN